MVEYNYAMLDKNNKITNIVVGDHEGAEEIIKLLAPDAENVVFIDSNTGPAYIDGDFFEGEFRIPKPYPSWVWSAEDKKWHSPIPYPQDNKTYTWDENNGNWEEYIPEQPYPSWSWNEESWSWQPPIPLPEDQGASIWDEESQSWVPFTAPN